MMDAEPILELIMLRTNVRREYAVSAQTVPISILRLAEGFLGMSWGFLDQDPAVLVWFIRWETTEACRLFAQAPAYDMFLEEIHAFTRTHVSYRTMLRFPRTPAVHFSMVRLTPEMTRTRNQWRERISTVWRILEANGVRRAYRANWIFADQSTCLIMGGSESPTLHRGWRDWLSEEDRQIVYRTYREGIAEQHDWDVIVAGEVEPPA